MGWWDVAYPLQAGRWKFNQEADTFEGANIIQTKISSWNIESKRTALCIAKINMVQIHSKQMNRLGVCVLGTALLEGPWGSWRASVWVKHVLDCISKRTDTGSKDVFISTSSTLVRLHQGWGFLFCSLQFRKDVENTNGFNGKLLR